MNKHAKEDMRRIMRKNRRGDRKKVVIKKHYHEKIIVYFSGVSSSYGEMEKILQEVCISYTRTHGTQNPTAKIINRYTEENIATVAIHPARTDQWIAIAKKTRGIIDVRLIIREIDLLSRYEYHQYLKNKHIS